MLHIILPDFADYKTLKPGPKDKIIFIAPEDGNSSFGAEALILCSKAKTEVVSVGTSSPIRMAYEIGRIAGNEKGDVAIHSSDAELSGLTAKKPARTPRKTSEKVIEKIPSKPVSGISVIPVPVVKETKQAPRKASVKTKSGKADDSAILRLLKANKIDSKYLSVISEQFSKDESSPYSIDVLVKTAVLVAGATKEEADIIGELMKKHYNEVAR